MDDNYWDNVGEDDILKLRGQLFNYFYKDPHVGYSEISYSICKCGLSFQKCKKFIRKMKKLDEKHYKITEYTEKRDL